MNIEYVKKGDYLLPNLAIENQNYFISCCLTGKINESYNFSGHSQVIDYRGKVVLGLEYEEKALYSEIDLEEMKQYFDLPKLPQRIEIYDNSHNQGTYAVGAMVVATPEGFDKKSYRTFNIKDQSITNDDFAMMKEVLKRRFDRMSPENKPDVILLDGGLGQLHAVHEALKDYDLSDKDIIVAASNAGWIGHSFKDYQTLLPNSNIKGELDLVFGSGEKERYTLKTSYKDIDNWLNKL